MKNDAYIQFYHSSFEESSSPRSHTSVTCVLIGRCALTISSLFTLPFIVYSCQTSFTDQQRGLSRNEPQMQTSMPRRTRTESGYAPGSPEYNASRDLPTNYGGGGGNGGDTGAPYNDGKRTASVSAHGSWWDNTGHSRDANHGTQGNFQTFTDQQRKTSRLREDERGHSPEYRYY